MKINIDAQSFVGNKTGVGQYASRLFKSVIANDPQNHYQLILFKFFLSKKPLPQLPALPNMSTQVHSIIPGRIFSKLLKFGLLPNVSWLFGPCDVFIFPNFVTWPVGRQSKKLLFIYDISYIVQAEHADDKNRAYLEKFVPKSIFQASHIITISESSRKEIMHYYNVPKDKISIVYPAVDHAVFYSRKQTEMDSIKAKYGITNNYILFTGTLEPRKNIVTILDAYAALPNNVKSNFTLVLAGGKGWLDESINQRLTQLSDLNILPTGYVPDEDLPALYSGASLFVYPSLYEGFGMPPLEAMACGVPVITSNNSSLPEVVGDAGIMIEAYDVKELSKQMQNVLSDAKLSKQMVQKGLVRARKFSWEKSAAELKSLIDQVGIKKD